MSAYDFVKKIARRTRYAGTEGEKHACELIEKEFSEMGIKVSAEPTEYIASELYMKILGLVNVWLIFVFVFFSGYLHSLTLFIIAICYLAFFVKLYPKIELKMAKSESMNLVATINPESKKRLILCGHYDSAKIMGQFLQRHMKKLNKIMPVIELLFLAFIVLILVRGIYEFWNAGFDIASLLLFDQGFNQGNLMYLWLFYIAFSFITSLFATYLLLTILTEKYAYGADDNASGIAVMLEAAKQIKEKKLDESMDMRIDFGCFAAEEKGLFGSRKWVNKHINEFDRENTYVLNLDCVGRGERFFLVKGLGTIPKKWSDPMLYNLLEECCHELGYPYEEEWADNSDHAEFIRKKLKCSAFNRCDLEKAGLPRKILRRIFRTPIKSEYIPFMDWIHTEKDVVEIIDEKKIEESVTLTLCFLEKLNKQVGIKT